MQNPMRTVFFLIVKCQVALQSGSPTHNQSVSLCRCGVFGSKPIVTLVQGPFVCLLFVPVFHLHLSEGLQSADLMTFCPHVACALIAMATSRNQKGIVCCFPPVCFCGKKAF